PDLAAGFGVGITTAWRYVEETVALLAARAPKLRKAVRGTARRSPRVTDRAAPTLWIAVIGGVLGAALVVPSPLPRFRLPSRGACTAPSGGRTSGSSCLRISTVSGPVAPMVEVQQANRPPRRRAGHTNRQQPGHMDAAGSALVDGANQVSKALRQII